MYTIIGAGIGGLTTALAFEKLGIEYEIYEKARQLVPVGAGILLTPNALTVFEWLGILGSLMESGDSMNRITLANAQMSPLFDYHQEDIKKEFGYHSINIHRWELQRILLDHIPSHKIHLGKSFVKFEQKENVTSLLFEDNTTVVTDYVIGADGINSNIRKQLFPKSTLRYSGQTCWRGVCQLDTEETLDYQHRGVEMWGDQVRFGISKIEKDTFYWFAVILSPPNGKDVPGTIKSTLSEIFKNFHPIVQKLIDTTMEEQMIRSDLYDVKPMSHWYKENICLIGDAAHATTPNMGQGGAQAIEDAYFLAHTINEVWTDNVFKVFQKKRMRKVNSIVRQSWMLGKTGHWKLLSGLRNRILKHTPWSLFKTKWKKVYRLE